jgi:hypothetical protein
VAKLGLPVQGIVVVMLVGALLTEAVASRREKAGAAPGSGVEIQHRWFFATLGLIAVAATFSGLDASRRWCDPSSHVFQGHAIWHCFAAVALCVSLLHYRQFRERFV